MEDAILLWFWVLCLLLMNYKWQQGKWRTPAVTVCQPHSLCVRFLGCITFFFSVHLHHSLRFPLSPLPPLPFLTFLRGDWKVKERAASLIRPREPQRMGLGWGSAGDLWMWPSDVITVMLSKQHLTEQVQSSVLSHHLLPDRQAEKEPSSEMFLIKRCCFFPPAYQSRSQQVDWNRACSLLVLHSLCFYKLFIYCYQVLVFLKCVFNERWLLSSWYIMSWAKTYSAQCDFSHHSIFFLPKTCFFPL